MYGKLKTVIAVSIGLACVPGFLLPVRLQIDVPEKKAYRYEDIAKEDIKVYASPLLTRGRQLTDFEFSKESNGAYRDIVVSSGFLKGRKRIVSYEAESIKASYGKEAMDGDAFDPEAVTVKVAFGNGSQKIIRDYTLVDPPELLIADTTVNVDTLYGKTQLEIEVTEAEGLDVEEKGKIYEGEDVGPNNTSVKMIYENGAEKEITNFVCVPPADLNVTNPSYDLLTSYGRRKFTVSKVPLLYATPGEGEIHYVGRPYEGSIYLHYEDGTVKEISSEDVEFPDENTLTDGKNKIRILVNGVETFLYVFGAQENKLTDAEEKYQGEIYDSAYKYVTGDLIVTVRTYIGDTKYNVAHILLNAPSEIGVESAGDGNAPKISAVQAASGMDYILAVNGSAYDRVSGGTYQAPLMIRDGDVLADGESSGYEICLTEDGILFSPPPGVKAEDLYAFGVKDVLITTEPVLISDGNPLGEGSATAEGRQARTAIGMVEPGEYYIITTSDPGLEYDELQAIFYDLGCNYARPLSGGAQVVMAYEGKAIMGDKEAVSPDYIVVRSRKEANYAG